MDDLISRQAALDELRDAKNHTFNSYYRGLVHALKIIANLPSVTPQPKMGQWIYDDIANNWRCDKCGETPKTMGYVGSDKFMAEHFKFCNHCGAKMEVAEE